MTSEVVEAANTALRNLAFDAINDAMKGWERRSRGSKFMSFKAGRPIRHEPEAVLIEDDSLEIHKFECCDKSAKVSALDAALILKCPYCGAAE